MRNPWDPVGGEKVRLVAYVLLWLAMWGLVLTQVAIPLGQAAAL